MDERTGLRKGFMSARSLSNYIGIFPNLDKPDAIPVARDLLEWLDDRGVKAVVPIDAASLMERTEAGLRFEEWPDKVKMVFVLGGDGTILNVAKMVANAGIPLLGINLGHLGFLTEVELPDLYKSLPQILRGEFEVEERMMVQAQVVREERVILSSLAFNEITITKGPFARLIHINLFVDDNFVDRYPADGIIVSTPTGSTAYSLSAGGPIVSPNLDILIITPICPHTLYSRSLIISHTQKVSINLEETHDDSMITIDGQKGFKIMHKDKVLITKAQETARLARLPGWNFFDVLRKKLKEGS